MKFNFFREKDLERRKRQSNVLRSKADMMKVINARLMVIVAIVLSIFAVFIFRVGNLQLFNQAEYQRKLEAFTSKTQTISPIRGGIYDINGKPLATSVKVLNISYYPNKNSSDLEEWNSAKKLVDAIGAGELTITNRQLKDMYISYKSQVENDNLDSLLSKKEREGLKNGTLSQDEAYDLKLARINTDEFSKKQKGIFQVKMLMQSGSDNEFKIIIPDCTSKQFAYLAEHKKEFQGFIGTYGWKRKYYDRAHFGSLVGNISTSKQGLPSEESDYYQALGYALNDSVGTSGVEEQYEQYLAGTNAKYEIKYDESGNAYLDEKNPGKQGYDLTLTINTDYQKKVDDIIKRYFEEAKNNEFRKYWNSAYFVAVDLKTGGIISMNGVKKASDGKIYYDPTSTYLDADRVGSCVKIATIYMGENEGVVKPGEVINDAPMMFRGTQPIKSFNNYGKINDVEAIAVSSNVYMWEIALRLGGSTYKENSVLKVNPGTLDKIREYFNMFGLGVKTGIDLPNEQVGNIGASEEPIKSLYQVIGQYDTYTPMQLAQYVTTVANNGQRLQLHVLDKVTEVEDKDSVVYQKNRNVLSVVKGNGKNLDRGQKGMRECANNGHCEGVNDYTTSTKLATKSGTAENEIYKNGEQINTTNNTMIAYGPYDNPRVAFICFAPNANNGFGGSLQPNIAGQILGECARVYFQEFDKK